MLEPLSLLECFNILGVFDRFIYWLLLSLLLRVNVQDCFSESFETLISRLTGAEARNT